METDNEIDNRINIIFKDHLLKPVLQSLVKAISSSSYQKATDIFKKNNFNDIFIKDKKNINLYFFLISEQKCLNQIIVEMAIQIGELATVTYLIEKNIQEKLDFFYPYEPLYYALKSGHLEIVKYFVEKRKENIYAKDKFGTSALHILARYGHLSVFQYFVEEKDMDIYQKDNDGITALHVAISFGQLCIVKYLVEQRNVDILQKDNHGFTARGIATLCHQSYIVEYLTNKESINIEQNNNSDKMPHLAAKIEQLPSMEDWIKQQGMNCDQLDNNGNTLLHLATLNWQIEVIKYLIKQKGMDIDKKNNSGNTPLHIAIQLENIEIIQLLVKNGAKVDEKNEDGYTALQLISFKRKYEICLEKAFLNGIKDKINQSVDEVVKKVSNQMKQENFLPYDAAIRYHSLIREIFFQKTIFDSFESNDVLSFLFFTLAKLIKLNLPLITASAKPQRTKREANNDLIEMVAYYKIKLPEIKDELELLPFMSHKVELVEGKHPSYYITHFRESQAVQSEKMNRDYADITDKIKHFEWVISKNTQINQPNNINYSFLKPESNAGNITFTEGSLPTGYIYNDYL